MIHIEITPVGVQRVTVGGDNPLDQDLHLIVWPLIREHVNRIDRQLKREAPGMLERLRPSAPASSNGHGG